MVLIIYQMEGQITGMQKGLAKEHLLFVEACGFSPFIFLYLFSFICGSFVTLNLS